ncbi:hypothetical protein [Sporosarcina jiandibaonis]|uniref:hypothetical protein n=1 Tax=Sporosarcina jiandibaonis TaxID=2715535 RepID=UPI001554FA93|nr:hypothetical protein [Sporosarcina jiandibaonis]
MRKLTEKDFVLIKEEVLKGRLTIQGMRRFLLGTFAFSVFLVGLAFAVANANTVGWDTLSNGWHALFYVQGILLSLHLLIILLCWSYSAFNQKVLSVSVVVITYKVAFDPYLTILMFSKDRGIFDSFAPWILMIIVGALILHVFFLVKWMRDLKAGVFNNSKSKKLAKSRFIILMPILFLLVAFTGGIFKSGILGDSELLIILFIFVILTICLLYAVCELIIACYCIFRFPSFSVNAPKRKNVQHANNKKNKKKKKNRNRKRR